MNNATIEQLPIWRSLGFELDAGNSVRLSIPRFCGAHALLRHTRDFYINHHKWRAAFVSIARHTTTGQLDFETLWRDIAEQLGVRSPATVDDEMQFRQQIHQQVAKTKTRLLLILNGIQPGMEAKCYSLLQVLHSIHARYGIGDAARFQFVVSDEFLIDIYGYQMSVDWSDVYTVSPLANGVMTKAEVSQYLAGVSPHARDSAANEYLTQQLDAHAGGHLGLITEMCRLLRQYEWQHDAEHWNATIGPRLYESKVLEDLRNALRDDPTGLARTAMDLMEPDYAVEYNSPRISQLRRLGILYRYSGGSLALVGGMIRTLVEGLAHASPERRVGTVQRQGGMASFVEEQYVAADDDIVAIHISDLHVGNDHAFRLSFSGRTINPEVSSFAELLERDIDSLGLLGRVDCLIVSGDIVCRGEQGEFARAAEVLQDVMRRLRLTPDKLLISPGNHDIKWDPGELDGTAPGNTHVSRDGYDMLLQIIGKKPAAFDQVTIVSRSGRRRLRIIGFDSNHVEGKSAAGIGYVAKEALEAAGRALDERNQPRVPKDGDAKQSEAETDSVESLTWFVVHHHVLPVCDVSIEDAQQRRVSVMGNASQILGTARAWNVEAILHGHQHQPAIAQTQRWIGEIGTARFAPVLVVGAGSCGAKRERLGPISYNHYFVLARQSNAMLVRSRTIQSGAINFATHDDLLIDMVG